MRSASASRPPLAVLSLAAALIAALVLACTPDRDARTTPTATSTGTATADVTATPDGRSPATPPPDGTPTPAPTSAGFDIGLVLIDVQSGEVTPIEGWAPYPIIRGFEANGSFTVYSPEDEQSTRFDSSGDALESSEGWPFSGSCLSPSEGTACGVESPDGRWVLEDWRVHGRPGGGQYETWLRSLATGKRYLLTDETRACGGCDSFSAPSWSPSARFLLFGQPYFDEDSAVYLTDTTTMETRVVARGEEVNRPFEAPAWSPTEDVFVRPEPGGGSALEHPSTGATIVLPDVPWPARFDDSGRFVYSTRGPTVVADADTGDVVATWSGRVQTWPSVRSVTVIDNEPAGVLLDDTCDGTLILRMGSQPRCIEGAQGASWSPAGAAVAYARSTAVTPTPSWEVVLLDLDTGSEIVLLDDVDQHEPPHIVWNRTGTHMLVMWPPLSPI